MSSKSSSELTGPLRISGPGSAGKNGPAFVGQVFSMCNLSGTGLMAVSTHFNVPFLSERTPEWLKKMLGALTMTKRNDPVFRFFMDLGDAVSYVKRLNIPSGVVGACRLDLAYDQFKEKPDLFQFVPNKKQVKEANKLLKTMPQKGQKNCVDGVPVFSAQNLDVAIATKDGIKWYTPYFFDKRMLDKILEESVDQHFHSLIHSRHQERRQDVFDDNVSSEMVEEMRDGLWELPEVLEAMEEIDLPGIPWSAISKAAEIPLLDAVDNVLLGNRWLRRAIGIQPKFPYMVDSFERRSLSSFQRACNGEAHLKELNGSSGDKKGASHPQLHAFLPNVTMIGVSMGEADRESRDALKKTVEDLTVELECTDKRRLKGKGDDLCDGEERDPLFVANVGAYLRNGAGTGSTRWVRPAGTS